MLTPERELAYVPSGSVYRSILEARDVRGEGILALGDPDYDAAAGRTRSSSFYGKLARLPETKAEAEAVGDVRLLGAARRKQASRRPLLRATAGAPSTSRATASSIVIGHSCLRSR